MTSNLIRWAAGVFLAAVLTVLGGIHTVHAQVQTKDFNVPAQPATTGIPEFARQAGIQILVSEPLVRDKRVAALSGTHSIEEALGILLKGTGLVATSKDGTTYTVARASSSSKAQKEGPSGAVAASVIGSEQEAEERAGLAEILVKGSRIMNVDVTRTEDDAQPYYILNSQQIEQSGAADVEDFLKQRLTMNTAFSTNSQLSFFSGNLPSNTSNINLRGLGSNETLVLIDGRRSASVINPSSVTATQPDINGIPLSAIERIEVLPSSASAIYGGAALGGVVNIILKKNFSGGEFNYSYDDPFNARALRQNINASYGFSLEDGKTRVMLSGSYSYEDPLQLQDRLNLVGRGISNILRNSPSYIYNLSNPFPGATPNIVCEDANGNPTNCVLKNGTSLNSPITSIPAGAAPGANLTAGLLANAGRYNLNLGPGTEEYGLQDEFGTVPTTKSFMATLRREFTSSLEVFTEFSTTSNAGRAVYNPFSGNYTVPASAPDSPFEQTVLINFPSAFSAQDTSDSVSQSATVGLIQRLHGDWSAEFDYTWSRNSVSYVNFIQDGNPLSADLAAGTLNPFVDTIAHPLDLAPYLGSAFQSIPSTLNDLSLRASGPLGSFPWGVPRLTIGLEHRKEGFHDFYSFDTFPNTPADDFIIDYFGQSQSTNSVYAEANLPLVAAKNAVPGIDSLDLQLAGRAERYTVFARSSFAIIAPAAYQAFNPPPLHTTVEYTSTNPTIALKYQPVKDFTLRASYATAFLPPTAGQFLLDPFPACGPSPCVTITDPRNGETYLVNSIGGGNPNLQPQTSRDVDLGVIWEPKEEILNGFRADLEYYKITQPNYIVSPTEQQVVSTPALASRVTRDPVTGLITVVNASALNASEYKTNGWDLSIDYHKPTVIGNFGLHARGTVIEHDLRQYTIGSPFFEYAGYPADGGEAKTKANMTLSWQYRAWTLAWTTTYASNYKQYDTPGSPSYIQNGGVFSQFPAAQGGDVIPSQVYHDFFGSYSIGTIPILPSKFNIAIQLGIRNVFNSLPPFDAYSPPYFYSTYGDPRLRDYRLSVKMTL